jgi:hypothetical protein
MTLSGTLSIWLKTIIFISMQKRIADIMEKLGVAGLAVGLFQSAAFGYAIGLLCLAYCLYLTRRMEK